MRSVSHLESDNIKNTTQLFILRYWVPYSIFRIFRSMVLWLCQHKEIDNLVKDLHKIPNFVYFRKNCEFRKTFCRMLFGKQFPAYWGITSLCLGKKNFPENYPKFAISKKRENREFCKKFGVILIGLHQSTYTPNFKSISHFVTKI